MLFIQSGLLSVAALASVAIAQSQVLKVTTAVGPCQAAKPCSFDFTTTGSGPVTVVLRKGISTNLKDVETLSTNAAAGTFTFTPKTDLAPGSDYAIQLKQGSEENYSPQFAITGGTGPTGSSSSGSSASTAHSTTGTASLTTVTSLIATTVPTISSVISSAVVPIGNGTSVTIPTLSRSGTATATSQGSVPTNTGNAAATLDASSPVALLFGAVAAFVYLN